MKKIIKIVLSRVIPFEGDLDNPELNRIIIRLAEAGWDLDVSEVKFNKTVKSKGIVLGEE